MKPAAPRQGTAGRKQAFEPGLSKAEDRLAAALGSLADGDFSVRLSESGFEDPEIARAFNRLADRCQAVTSAIHDVRNELAEHGAPVRPAKKKASQQVDDE